MKLLMLACLGGAVGAGGRYLVSVAVARVLGTAAGFPWATSCVNVGGSFLMGVFIEALALRLSGSSELRTLVATGVLGGFTSFSAFSLDFATLIMRKDEVAAAVYLVSSVMLSILALYAGLAMTRQVLT
jgi:fluoride exporter